MTPEQDVNADLVATHPVLFRHPDARTRVEIPFGWYARVDRLLGDLERALGEHRDRFTVLQIKEKFAGLRFYWTLDLPEPPGQPLPAVIRAHPGGVRVRGRSGHPLKRRIEALVAAAEEQSMTICQWCGAGPACVVVGGAPAGARRDQPWDGTYHAACARCGGDALTSHEWVQQCGRG